MRAVIVSDRAAMAGGEKAACCATGGRHCFTYLVFFQYMAQYMKTKLQYRTDLLIEWLSDLMAQAVNLVFLLVVFGHTTLLHGWSRDEILFIYGFFLVPYAVFGAFFNLWDFNERYIVQGEMDRVLTRPLNSLFQIVLERMELESLLGAVPGLIIMLYAGSRLSLSFHWYDVFVFILLVIGGALIYAGIFISLATISFFSRRPHIHHADDVQHQQLWPLPDRYLSSRHPLYFNVGAAVCLCRRLSSCLFS